MILYAVFRFLKFKYTVKFYMKKRIMCPNMELIFTYNFTPDSAFTLRYKNVVIRDRASVQWPSNLRYFTKFHESMEKEATETENMRFLLDINKVRKLFGGVEL